MVMFLIGSVLAGALIGCLARLLVPGRRRAGGTATISCGVTAAGIAYVLDFMDKAWLVLALQVVLAVSFLGVVSLRVVASDKTGA
ncbi:GlsB/YeaQ/YmgE family stress response membrane protein [Nonomuraea sp. CA-143628]|uniref:GlsB/YeaQ/YmgE family stress response membrane protein n=1 Tax=Nonomuraea sp. CA-143628 TaxID=3239997 RepID=UPI003D907B10